MASKVFLDANIILDLTLKRPAMQKAIEVFKRAESGELQLFTTPSVIHVVSYFTSRYYSKHQRKKAILLLLNQVQIIECDHGTTVIAISSSMEDIEDALQYYTALKHNLDYFISSDKKLKKAALPQLPVYTAAELGKLYG
jgi:predicted nucleic acid-binding protein